MILTANGVMRGKKPIPLYEIVNAAADICGEACMLIDTMIVLQRLPEEQMTVPLVTGRDVWWHDAVAEASADCPVVWVDSEDPLFVLYTSGSTGKPKGVRVRV